MSRTVKEWIGKTPDEKIPLRVKLRIKARANDCCESCGVRVRYNGQFDHRPALINGGENRESRIQFICKNCHSARTKTDVAEKSVTARKQAHLSGFRNTRKPFYVKRERSTLPLRVTWIDEQGRDRVTWLKPVQPTTDGDGH